MAKMVLKAAYLNLNATDLSSYTSKIELTAEVEDKDVTTFTSLGWKEVLGGLASGTLAITFKQDIAAAALDSIMWGLFGTVVTFETRLTQSARSTSNPAYTGNVLVKTWVPISGSPGDVAEVSVSYPTSAQVQRQTS